MASLSSTTPPTGNTDSFFLEKSTANSTEDSDFTFATPNRTEGCAACDFTFATMKSSTKASDDFTFPTTKATRPTSSNFGGGLVKMWSGHSTKASAGSSSSSSAASKRSNELVCVGKSNRGVTWGFSLSQGLQATMEDAICIVPGLLRLPCPALGGCRAPHCSFAVEDHSPVHYFALFDGHGGSQVSHYCSTRLHKLLAEEWDREVSEENWSSKWEIALSRAFNRADDAFKDRALAPYTVGSTALVVILSACQIIVANCGDSRAVLCRGGQAIPLTSDHKLDREDEEARVIRGGARILYLGCPRVEGILSMTRAIGDQDLKQWVISEPEVTFFTRTEEDECLILASDGLWDVMSNEEVMGLARRMLKEQRRLFAMGTYGSSCPAQYVAQEVVTHALHTSSDNVSVIVVDLKRLRRKRQPKAADTCRSK